MEKKIKYKHNRIIGECIVSSGFERYIDILCRVAERYNAIIYIISSFRFIDEHIGKTVVAPAKRSNHYVGYAIDMNLKIGNRWYNSRNIGEGLSAVFVEEVEKSGMRWGGRFEIPDRVHFDYPLNIKDPDKYNLLFEQYQRRHA